MTLFDPKLLVTAKSAWRALLPMRRTPPKATAEPLEICMVVISDVRSDPRVRREAETLAQRGYRVKILYPDCYTPKFNDAPIVWSPNISFRPLPCEDGQYYAKWPYVFGANFHAMVCEERPWAFHSHDLNTALIALSAAKVAGAYCVCDFHEWYSENVSWDYEAQAWGPHPPDKRNIYKLLERVVMRNANAVITVSDSIADAIRDELAGGRRRPWVIRNVPKLSYEGRSGKYDVRKELGLDAKTFVVLWQGGIGPSRLLEPVIRAFAQLPKAVFAIRTPYWEAFGKPYEDLAAELGISDRIRRLDAVPSQDIVRSAAGADVGLWTLPNPCRNFYLALGNKIFEYLAAGLPILVADYPEARRIVQDHGVGLTFDPYSPESIAASIRAVQSDRRALKAMREQVPAAFDALDADREWEKLVALYDSLREHGVAEVQPPPAAKPARERSDAAAAVPGVSLVGYPAEVAAPNARFARPYRADRAGMQLRVRGGRYLREQPISFWWDDPTAHPGGPVLLRNRITLSDGDLLVVADDRLHDLSVGTPLIAVRRASDGLAGFITQDALITQTVALDGAWVAIDEKRLRSLVEFPSEWGVLHSTNRVSPVEQAATAAYLQRFAPDAPETEVENTHPLECGAHAHRLGVWALAEGRDPADRARVAAAIDRMMRRYLIPKMTPVGDDAATWPYTFEFKMPWATTLTPPWHSGYANAAITGAAACAFALTGERAYADVARRAFAFLRRPMAEGGAHYTVDGFDHIAEYLYRSPPIPNARVLDGELCAIPYLVNAGLLLDEPGMVEFAAKLAAGQSALLELLNTADDAPYFCMDGQPMQPTYMWQLWMCLQLLAAIFKDRGFAKRATAWRLHIPESFETDEFPF